MAEVDTEFMGLAIEEAERARSAGEVPVGAVVVDEAGRVLGRAFNQPISRRDPTAHAEILALREACAVAGNYRLLHATLYCTKEPCTMCAGAIVHARVRRLVYGASDPKAGAAGSLYNVVADRRLNHQVEVTDGVREAECRLLLQQFFAERRTVMARKVAKSEEDWEKELSPAQYQICRMKGTEPPFTGEYYKTKTPGMYSCACCGAALFDSSTKYESGSGWPSFWKPVDDQSIDTKEDITHGMRRTEILCSSCGAHLGHVFEDGPQPTGLRYCVNSVSLKLKEK
jgi:peptide-methionine (R)-S-oxide reductase